MPCEPQQLQAGFPRYVPNRGPMLFFIQLMDGILLKDWPARSGIQGNAL
jgi:hypothetical protein